MNRKGRCNDGIFDALIPIFVLMTIYFFLSSNSIYDYNCLEKFADKYCDKLKMEYIENSTDDNSFKCNSTLKIDENRNYDKYEFKFYFLEKEQKRCELDDK